MIEQYYNLDYVSKYQVIVKKVDIEDADENSLTREELYEIRGLHRGLHEHTDRPQLCFNTITEELEQLASSIKEGKKSEVMDDELLHLLQDGDKFISDFIKGYVRRGNRLYLKPKKSAKLCPPSDSYCWGILVGMCNDMLNEDRIRLQTYWNADKVKTVELLKKLYSWKDIQTQFSNPRYTVKELTLEGMKKVFKNPNACNFK